MKMKVLFSNVGVKCFLKEGELNQKRRKVR
jgi:hypothetical protein